FAHTCWRLMWRRLLRTPGESFKPLFTEVAKPPPEFSDATQAQAELLGNPRECESTLLEFNDLLTSLKYSGPRNLDSKNDSSKVDNDHHEKDKKTTYTSVQSADRPRVVQGRADPSSDRLKARRSSQSVARMEKYRSPGTPSLV